MPLSTAAAYRKDTATKTATFTHQHFREVAAILRGLQDVAGLDVATHDRILQRFANALWHTNPRFDRARFLAACGGEA